LVLASGKEIMKKSILLTVLATIGVGASAGLLLAWQEAKTGIPVHMVVTMEPRRESVIPQIDRDNLAVYQGKDQRPVTGFEPLNGSSMQLLILIGDSSGSAFNTNIDTLKQFVNALPSTTEAGIGYMRNGMTQMAASFTSDHAAAANGIRLAAGPGGADVSPYDSLTEAIKRWPKNAAKRREVIMISSGIEGLEGGYTSNNQYVNAGIAAAQKAGVIVYCIYVPSVGHYGHSFWRTTWGQNFLSQLADETGGESYMVGFSAPVSLKPFLDRITTAMQHQYLLTFTARAEDKASLRPVRIVVISKDASIAAADKVYVRAGL
jgi:hypothetical protein